MYPLFLDLRGRLCVVVGGGGVAERKVRGILAAEGRVRLVSPEATPSLQALADAGTIEWRARGYQTTDLEDGFLLFAATDSPVVQSAATREARAAGLLVNRADAPEDCDFQVPATLRRGDLTLCVATGGRSPALAAMVRRRLEREMGPEYGMLVALMARLRTEVLASGQGDGGDKKILFETILHDDILDWLRAGRWDLLQAHLEAVLGRPVEVTKELLTGENA